MERLARLFFCGYMLMLPGIGGSGIVIAACELPHIFEVRLDPMDKLRRASLLGRYRFLTGLAPAFGVFSRLFQSEIFLALKASRVLLAGLCAGVAARVLVCVMDSIAARASIALCVLEAATGFPVREVVWRGRTS